MGNLVGDCLKYLKPKVQSGPKKSSSLQTGIKTPSPQAGNIDSTFISKLDVSSGNLILNGNLFTNEINEKKHLNISFDPPDDRVNGIKEINNNDFSSPYLPEKVLKNDSKLLMRNDNINLTMSQTGESLYGESLPNNISPEVEQKLIYNQNPSKITKIFDAKPDVYFDVNQQVSNINPNRGPKENAKSANDISHNLFIISTADEQKNIFPGTSNFLDLENDKQKPELSPSFPLSIVGSMVEESNKFHSDNNKETESPKTDLLKPQKQTKDFVDAEIENEFLDIEAMNSELRKIKERNENLVTLQNNDYEEKFESNFPKLEDGYLVSSCSRLPSSKGNQEKNEDLGNFIDSLGKNQQKTEELNENEHQQEEKPNELGFVNTSSLVEKIEQGDKKRLGTDFENQNHIFNRLEDPIQYEDFSVDYHEENLKT